MHSRSQRHIVIIEAYEGCTQFVSDAPEERQFAQGVGLPVEEIAALLESRVTILCWDKWFRYESKETWVPTPVTRPSVPLDFSDTPPVFTSARVRRVPISTRDPEYWLPIEEKGLSPRSYGLINDSGLLFFLAYCLNKELQALHAATPFQTVILPMWGGMGYVAQMARATRADGCIDVPFVVVVTDTSGNRQMANQEGIWTRQATVLRQMEDVSLALADLVLVFGPKGYERAVTGRLPEAPAPVYTPRFVATTLLDAITHAAQKQADVHGPLQFFLYEPQQAAAGVLTALDAVCLLAAKGVRLARPVVSAGPPMVFAPMKPREFTDYWSSRGFVQELVHARYWEWSRAYPQLDRVFPVRLYPSLFDHLPSVWGELARGSLVLLSPAAAEGLAPGEVLPQEVLIQGDPVPEKVADCLEEIARTKRKQLDQARRELCMRVVAAHRGEQRQRRLAETIKALGQLLGAPPVPQDLSRVALMFFDRRMPLRILAEHDRPPCSPEWRSGTKKGALSVVVTCYEMKGMLKEAVESVWASERQPDEVVLVDDGSYGEETLSNIRQIEQDALAKGLPLQVIRQRNQGLAAARNAGLQAARGEFISFLDGDDRIAPSFYRIALHLLERYPRLGGVAAWACIFGDGIPDGFWNAPQTEFPFLFMENSVVVPCLTRTELLRHLGGYDTRQRYNYEDWELSIRMLAARWPIITIPMHLTHYRVRQDSLYRSMTDVQNQVMRELLLTTHRESVAKFAVEIAMQLENQWKKLSYNAPNSFHWMPASNNVKSFCKMLLYMIKRFLKQTLTDYK